MLQGRLWKKKECRVPTVWGWLLLGLLVTAAALGWLLSVHALLACSQPIRARTLVLEGWVSSSTSLRLAAEEFKAHQYAWLLIAKDHERPWVLPMLQHYGVPADQIISIPVPPAGRDRTYNAAATLKEWLLASGSDERAVDVFTVGTHARRSWMLFRKALEPEFRVGIIAAPSPWYDAERWWRSSEGVKEVVTETIACLYTLLFFLPFQ